MIKPIEKTTRRSLVHHPSDALDAFCHYDGSNESWTQFNASVSRQLTTLEHQNRRYIRVKRVNRRSSRS
jgi:hypothetical protein